MSKFTLTQTRRLWNQSAEWCKDHALSLIEKADILGIDSIEKFAVRLRADFENWAFENNKNVHCIHISTWGDKYMGINRPNSTESSAVTITMQVPTGIIICGKQGTGKSTMARKLASEYGDFKEYTIKNLPVWLVSSLDAVIIDECPKHTEYKEFSPAILRGKIKYIFVTQFKPEYLPDNFELINLAVSKNAGKSRLRYELPTEAPV